MALTNKDSKVVYFAPRAQAPFIVRPKTDRDWQRDRFVRFEWLYNGFDAQYEYTIQILVKPLLEITDEEDLIWKFTDSLETPPGEIEDQYIYERVIQSSESFLNIDLNNIQLKNGSTVSLSDGAYRWRIKVRGIISQLYSPWANDGFVRLDAQGPRILNASAFSPAGDIDSLGDKSKLSAFISDMSMPYLRSRRASDSGFDRHVDRDGFPGFYVTYDYRDHSIVLRAQSARQPIVPKQRYYGLISFHKSLNDSINPEPNFNVQDVIKAAYLYTINKRDGSVSPLVPDDGPFQETLINDVTNSNLENILSLSGFNDRTRKIFRPRGFPTFLQGDIFSISIALSNKPATFEKPHETSFFSPFPIHSRFVPGVRKLDYSSVSSIFSTEEVFESFIEFRYGPPLESVFIYMSSDLTQLLAYGQYSNDAVNSLAINPNTTEVLQVTRGISLSKLRTYEETIQIMDGNGNNQRKYEIFDSNNVENLGSGAFYYENVEGGNYPVVPRSNYFFFNLVPTKDSDRDVALKLYLNSELFDGEYESNPISQILDSFEIHMFPDTDCSLAYKGQPLNYDSTLSGEDAIGTYRQPIPIDQVYIGRSKISPKSLPIYDIPLEGEDGYDENSQKKFYKYIMYGSSNTSGFASTILTPSEWGNKEDYFLDNSRTGSSVKFNGSFRIKIPEYKWASYYHPTSVYYSQTGDLATLPHILDANPNKGSVDNIINWDSIELKASAFDYFDLNNLMKFEFFYSSDFAKFEGGAQFFGQSHPHFYNHLRIQSSDYNVGTTLRLRGSSLASKGAEGNKEVKRYGWMTSSLGYGDLGFTLYNQGWSHDGTWYNFIDRGFFGLADVEPTFEYVEGSLQVFLNGQLLVNEGGIIENSENNSPSASYRENLNNLHEFEFINLSQGGLFSPPEEDDIISISFRVRDYEEKFEFLGPFYDTGNGSSSEFYTPEKFVPGTLRVFLNGMLLTENLDYSELSSSDGFSFISQGNFNGIPLPEDEITYYYKGYEVSAITEVRGPYFISGKEFSSFYSLENDFGRPSGEVFQELSLQVYFNGSILEEGVDYNESVSHDGFDLLVPVTSKDVVAIIYDVIPVGSDVIDEILAGPFFIKPNAADSRYSIRGYWSANSKIKTRIRFREFSNQLFRKSIKVLIDEDIPPYSVFTDKIKPSGGLVDNGETFIFDGGGSSVLDTATDDNTPSWILFNQNLSSEDLDIFTSNLVGSDYSAQGLYPVAGEGNNDPTWIASNRNILGGYFLIANNSEGDEVYDQIKRSIQDKPDIGDTITVFGPLRSSNNILETESALVSGDIFSMGNIFGKVYPQTSGQSKKVKIFIDLNEDISGINGIKYFVTDLKVSQSNDEQKSNYYWGSKNKEGEVQSLPIFMQKINNLVVDFSSASSVSQAISLFKDSRTSIFFVRWYFDNRIPSWTSISSKAVENISELRAGLGIGRIEHELNVNGEGYKLIYIQVRDKGNNASNIYCIPIYIPEKNEIIPNEIANVTVSVDEDYLSEFKTFNDGTDIHKFESALNLRDADEFRSVIFQRPLEKYNIQVVDPNTSVSSIKNTFRDHRRPDTILMGLSDNYGLSYNAYTPYTSVKNWRFDRPISIPIKSFTGDRGPEWYFDPNDIRHYPVDTEIDYMVGRGSIQDGGTIVLNNVDNSSLGFHVPMNGTLQPITLIGLRADRVEGSLGETFGKANPIAERIWENRDELIGKKIQVGALPSETFTILHVFRSNFLSDAKIFTSTGIQRADSFRRIDGDISGVRKVWIVVSDPDALCAMVLSRKFQYVNTDSPSVNIGRYDAIRYNTGTAKRLGLNWFLDSRGPSGQSGSGGFGRTGSYNFYETVDFGYYKEESEIPTFINELVNSALNMGGNISDGFNPSASVGYENAENYFYIIPSETLDQNSSITTGEGWTAQIFHAYDPDIGNFQNEEGILVSFDRYHNQLLGLKVYDKMVFGQAAEVSAIVSDAGIKMFTLPDGTTTNKPYVVVTEGRFDQTMGNLSFSLIDETNTEVSSGIIESVSSSTLNSISDGGRALIIDNALPTLDYSSGKYSLKVTLNPLETIDPVTGTTYSQGWFPNIDGFFVPYIGQPLGSVNAAIQDDVQANTKYAVVIRGAIYITEEGDYDFTIEKNSGAYSDLFVDYFDHTGLVTDVFEDYENQDDPFEIPTVTKVVGGRLPAFTRDSSVSNLTTDSQTFTLRKGWHTIKLRYVSDNDPINRPKQILNLKYSRPGWGETKLPVIGSNTNDYNFMAKSYRTVYARLVDDQNRRFPIFVGFGNTLDRTKSTRLSRAIVGFYESLVQAITNRLRNQIVKVERVSGENYGSVKIRTRQGFETSTTFGGSLIEEASGIYESSIIDGGGDFRFWRTISWTLDEPLPEGTSLEFFIRTAETEEELLTKTYNNTEDETNPNIIPAITVSGTDILKFSQQSINVADQPKIFRFLQFKMVLKSRNRGKTPTVNDVTITYSKLNSVNFFTTTFDLNSNIIRAILSYNGNIPVDSSGVALSEVQFGISTKEIVDGVVSTNFDDYSIIPIDEAFTLSDLGINASPNNKFRIGIKFISTENAVPTVDDFALMWETDGKTNRTKDFLE